MKKRNGKQKQRQKQKGFTLIELLAVITIMGILLLVAIPAVSRTIENSRKDTFATTAAAYLNAVKEAVVAEQIECEASECYLLLSTEEGNAVGYANVQALMESVAKSSWGNADLHGYVYWTTTEGISKYYVQLADKSGHGMLNPISEDDIKGKNKRANIVSSGAANFYNEHTEAVTKTYANAKPATIEGVASTGGNTGAGSRT